MSEITLNLIVSYAKSGSNWTRMVLDNYLQDADIPANIWETGSVPNGFSRNGFECLMGIPSYLLEAEELWQLMPIYLKELCENAKNPLYFKIHDANLGIIPPEIFPKVRVIYLIRNPLDVVVSYSHHFGVDYDQAIARLKNPLAMFNSPENTQRGLLPIRSHAWAEHVASWVDQSDFSVEILHYEDMVSQPMEQFSRMIQLFCGELDEKRLKKAIKFSSIDELRHQERSHKKVYHKHQGASFFRKGQSGTWHKELTALQIEAVEKTQGVLMRRFGYV